jgi:hypothetical protein
MLSHVKTVGARIKKTLFALFRTSLSCLVLDFNVKL